MNEKEIRMIMKQETEIPKRVEEAVEEALWKICTEGAGQDKHAEQSMSMGQNTEQNLYTDQGIDVERRRGKRLARRRFWIPALAAAIAAGGVTVYAAKTLNWSRGFEKVLHLSEEQKVNLESNDVVDAPEVSAADAGVTVSMQQSIVDNSAAYLSFRVEGYEVPENMQPEFDSVEVTVGKESASYTRGFYNGVMMAENGRAVYDDGTELQSNEDGNLKINYTLADGSLEYQIVLYSNMEEGKFLNQPIHAEFKNLGVYSGKAEDVETQVEGVWTLDWTLQGTDEVREETCSAALGDTGAVVTGVRISPISIKVMYDFPRQGTTAIGYRESQVMVDGELQQVSEPFEYTEYAEPPYLIGVKMKDGTVHTRIDGYGGGYAGYENQESDAYHLQVNTSYILDPEQVQSLLFVKAYPEDGVFTEEYWYETEL